MDKYKKVLSFISIYGFKRTLVKSIGRDRKFVGFFPRIDIFKKKKTVSIIGAGQYSFSTIAFFIKKNQGFIIRNVFDINNESSSKLAKYYNAVAEIEKNNLFSEPIDFLFIASNHSSHTVYAIEAMKSGFKNIYIEKPVSVSMIQLVSLEAKRREYNTLLLSGYNRPF